MVSQKKKTKKPNCLGDNVISSLFHTRIMVTVF